MSDNKTDNKQETQAEARWYQLPLKDWAVIISALYFVITQSGAIAAYDVKLGGVLTALTDMNKDVKEIKQKQEGVNKELTDKLNKLSTDLEVMKARVESLENKR